MDLRTSWLGLDLANPLVHSASPLSRDLDTVRRLEDAGCSAIVLYSLFEEELTAESRRLDHFLSTGEESQAEALSYFPQHDDYRVGPDEYLEHVRRVREAVDVPVVGSLNGVSTGGWIEYARAIQDAGASALELNVYWVPTDPELSGAEVERALIEVVRDVRGVLSIPLAVKIGPFYSAPANVARRLCEAGADGLVLFNRFYQPDLDIEAMEVTPRVTMSRSEDLLLPLRWTAILYGRIDADIAISTGVHTATDVLKGVMAGANVTMLTSELLVHGPQRAGSILRDVVRWMEEHEVEALSRIRGGMSQKHVAEPAAFERAQYLRVLHGWRPDPTGRLDA